MAIERTFSMIKPDATKRNLTGAITKVFEDNGLRIIAIDFLSIGPRIQRLMFWIVIAIWAVLLVGFVPRQLMHIFGGE